MSTAKPKRRSPVRRGNPASERPILVCLADVAPGPPLVLTRLIAAWPSLSGTTRQAIRTALAAIPWEAEAHV